MDLNSLDSAINYANSPNITLEPTQGHLEVLAAYECWQPFFRLLDEKMAKFGDSISDYQWLFQVQFNYLEEVGLVAVTAKRLVASLGLGYRQFREELLPAVESVHDYDAEVEILKAIFPVLKEFSDKVECLERMCYIYEKKKGQSELLTESYEQLIRLDPNNIKALKYFKAVNFHHREFEDVVGILERLYTAVSHPADKSRVAMEWAATLLYQMNNPKDAAIVVKKISHGSGLDTSTLSFEANYLLQDWDECLNVLADCLQKITKGRPRAVLCFKVGEIKERMGLDGEALGFYDQSCAADPTFLEPLENMIDLRVKRREWAEVMNDVDRLAKRVTDSHLKEHLADLNRRIGEGLRYAG